MDISLYLQIPKVNFKKFRSTCMLKHILVIYFEVSTWTISLMLHLQCIISIHVTKDVIYWYSYFMYKARMKTVLTDPITRLKYLRIFLKSIISQGYNGHLIYFADNCIVQYV